MPLTPSMSDMIKTRTVGLSFSTPPGGPEEALKGQLLPGGVVPALLVVAESVVDDAALADVQHPEHVAVSLGIFRVRGPLAEAGEDAAFGMRVQGMAVLLVHHLERLDA